MRTIYFPSRPKLLSTGTVAGPKECAGVVGNCVDIALQDDLYGESTYEKAECKMLTAAVKTALNNAGLEEGQLGVLILGDLLNQIISASFTARDFDCPFLGVYSACATLAEGYALAAMFVDGGYAEYALAATGSHFSSAERQYRYPLELGNTRPPQAQWTVTGAGGAVIGRAERGVSIVCATIGRVVDYGITDVNNMGAAMAPAAADVILRHLQGTGTQASDYDLIVTGDLGALGSRLLKDLLWEKGVDLQNNHVDCGEIIYNVVEDEFQGGSGAGCCAVVLNSYLLEKLASGEFRRILFAATGALLSTVSSGQGESIPCISHAITLEFDETK